MFGVTRYNLWILPLLLPMVLAESKAYVELINGTPYDWNLISTESHRMKWFPNTTIPSGTSSESCISWALIRRGGEAEATYRINNPSSPESFTIRARQKPTRIEILYHENLSSLNNPKNSIINLGYTNKHPHPFILAGSGTDPPYISTNPPIPWMQSTLTSLSPKTLREISMPMSHDAGANIVSHSLNGPGTLHNTQTQSVSIYQQLIYGARWLDIRPALYKGEWMTYHGSFVVGRMWGATGQSIGSMIEDINRFTREYPGELIVLDISHDANDERGWKNFDEGDWRRFYRVLSGIRDGWMEPHGLGWDLSSVPFNTFVTEGSKSAVLVRVPCGAPSAVSGWGKRYVNTTLTTLSSGCDPITTDNDFASANTTDSISQRRSVPFHLPFTPLRAFRLQMTGSFSDTSSPSFLITSQLSSLALRKSSSSKPIHKLAWILTIPLSANADIGNWWSSILGYAVSAQRELFRNFEGLIGSGKGGGKPNLIEVDYIRGSEVAALAMAVNVWGGKDL